MLTASQCETVLGDFLADLRHYARAVGADWERIDGMGATHFDAEEAGYE